MMSVLLIMITIKRVSCKVWLTRFFLVSHRLHFKKLSPKCSTRSSQTNERCKEGKVHLLYTVYGFKKQIIVFVCIMSLTWDKCSLGWLHTQAVVNCVK